MIQYQSTPDYYRDYIEHGYLKDQAAKVHKYLKRWKNDAGKWVYQYKNEIRDKRVANKRKEAGLTAPEWVSFNIMGKKLGAGPKGGIIAVRSDNGKPKSYGFHERRAARSRSTDQLKNALDSGRKRAAKKGYAVQGYRGKTGSNLSSRGYSTSETTPAFMRYGTYNKSRKRAATRREMEYYLNNDGKNMDTLTLRPVGNIYNRQGSNVEAGTKAGRKRVSKKKNRRTK